MKYFYKFSLLLVFTFSFSNEIASLKSNDMHLDSTKVSKEEIKYQKVPPVGNKELTFLNGDPVKFDDLHKDGPLLLSFWFLGCGPCIAEMKHLSKFNEKYEDSGFKVISINTDTKSKGKVKSFVKKKKYSFDMLFDVNGKNGLIKKLGANLCPFTALVNMDGTIYSKHLGYERGDEVALEKEILDFIEYNNQFKNQPTIDSDNLYNTVPETSPPE